MWAIVGYVVLGIIVVLGASVGVVMMLAKGIASNNAHDQKNCQCWDCRDRRARSLAKAKERMAKAESSAPWLKVKHDAEAMRGWLTTEELRVNDRVQGGGIPDRSYRVSSLNGSSAGVMVALINEKTNTRSIVTVPMSRLGKKIWKKAGPRHV
jgi:hypothetical protein